MVFSPLGILVMLGIFAIVGLAQWRVKSSYKKYSKIQSTSGMTARQVAQRILDYGSQSLGKPGLRDVKIESVKGKLTDHYDPRTKTLRLSQAESSSLADIGIAAHEAGHALQDASQYQPLVLRSAMVPVTQIGSRLASFLIMGSFIGAMFIPGIAQMWPTILILLIGAYGIIVAFSLITLPVEIDASNRAMRLLRDTGSVTSEQELNGVGKVLNAAALTYVAAAAAAIMQMAYYIFLLLGRR